MLADQVHVGETRQRRKVRRFRVADEREVPVGPRAGDVGDQFAVEPVCDGSVVADVQWAARFASGRRDAGEVIDVGGIADQDNAILLPGKPGLQSARRRNDDIGHGDQRVLLREHGRSVGGEAGVLVHAVVYDRHPQQVAEGERERSPERELHQRHGTADGVATEFEGDDPGQLPRERGVERVPIRIQLRRPGERQFDDPGVQFPALGDPREGHAQVEDRVTRCSEFTRDLLRPLKPEVPVNDREHEERVVANPRLVLRGSRQRPLARGRQRTRFELWPAKDVGRTHGRRVQFDFVGVPFVA